MKIQGRIILPLAVLFFPWLPSGVSGDVPAFDSNAAYCRIVRNESAAVVRAAVSALAGHYRAELGAGTISTESDRDLILAAISVIIDHLDDTDRDYAIDAFGVLATLQTDCPAPRKELWQLWWNRKRSGERIHWAVNFSTSAGQAPGPDKPKSTD